MGIIGAALPWGRTKRCPSDAYFSEVAADPPLNRVLEEFRTVGG